MSILETSRATSPSPVARILLQREVERVASGAWAGIVNERQSGGSFVRMGNGDTSAILGFTETRTRSTPPLMFYYGTEGRIRQFVQENAIRASPVFTREAANNAGIPARGVFPSGGYGFRIPPWANVSCNDLTRAAYGHEMVGSPIVSFGFYVALIPRVDQWNPGGYYAYSDISQSVGFEDPYHWCFRIDNLSEHQVVNFRFRREDNQFSDARGVPVLMVAFGRTCFG